MEFVSNYRIYHVNMPKVFRLSEQYLIRAEAYCQKEDFAKASADISTLRQARYQTYGSATLTSENWLDEIDKERLRELFMEGFRFWQVTSYPSVFLLSCRISYPTRCKCMPKLYFVFLYFRIKCSFCAVYPSILCDPVCSF